MAQVVMMLDEVPGKRVQQRRIRRWVGGAEIIDRLNQAFAHQLSPEAVHRGAREPGVLGRSHPIRKDFAPVLHRPDRGFHSVQKARPYNLLGIRMPILLVKRNVMDGFHRRGAATLPAHLREKCGHADKVVPLPYSKRMVMAARALDAYP